MWNKKTLLLLIVAVFGVLALMSPALAKKYEGGDEGDGVDAQGGSWCTVFGDQCTLDDDEEPLCIGEQIPEGESYGKAIFKKYTDKKVKVTFDSYEIVSGIPNSQSLYYEICYNVGLNNAFGELKFHFRDGIEVGEPTVTRTDDTQDSNGLVFSRSNNKFEASLNNCADGQYTVCFPLSSPYSLGCGTNVKALDCDKKSIAGPVLTEDCGEVLCEVFEEGSAVDATLKYKKQKIAKVSLLEPENFNRDFTYRVKTLEDKAEVRSIKICGFGDLTDSINSLGCSKDGVFTDTCGFGTVELKNGCVKFNAKNKKIKDKFYIHIRTILPYNIENDGVANLCDVSGTAKIPIKQKPKPPKDCPQQCPCCPCFPCFPYFGMGGCYGGCGGQHGGCGGGNHGGCGGSHGGYEGRCGGDHEVGYSAYDVQGSYESGKSKRVLVDIKSKDGVSCPNSEDPCFPDGEIAVQV